MKASHALFFTVLTVIISFSIFGCKEDDETSLSTSVSDTTAPTVISTSPSDSSTDIAINTSISITFSEAINASSVTANTTNTVCSGSFQLSSNDFVECIQVSEPTADTEKKVFTVQPASTLDLDTTYKLKITTEVADVAGNALEEEYVYGDGFTTVTEATSDTPSDPFFNISSISGNTGEDGTQATFTVKLKIQPTDDVTIGVSSSDETEGTVSPTSLTFTSENWNSDQTVTVTGENDDAIDGNQEYSIVLGEASSNDSNHDGLNPDDVSVTNIDDETAGFIISSISGDTGEDGTQATFTAKLTSQPTDDVTIGISSSDTTEGTVNSSSLTFTSDNWNAIQTVTVTGVNDAAKDGNQSFNIVLATASSDDTDYNELNPDDVAIINVDDDIPGFTIGTISGNTTEGGGTASFTVKLTFQPTANASIGYSSNDTAEGTVSGDGTMIFTSSNWDTSQTVIVTGINDSNYDGPKSYSIVLAAVTSSDGNYNSLNPTDVSVINEDDDWKLSDTGQVICYDWGNFSITCPSTGNSFFGQDAQYTGNNPSYTDNGNSTVTDNNTSLIWQKGGDNNTYTYLDAGSYCSDLTVGSRSDWRLPIAVELRSIVNIQSVGPTIDTTKFADTHLSDYWSSTLYHDDYDNNNGAVIVGFDIGNTTAALKTASAYVRCVIGSSIQRPFSNNGNGTVTDHLTKLIWQQEEPAERGTWEFYLSYCENLSLAGQSDWRMPNINELHSVVDYSKSSQTIYSNYFPTTTSHLGYWSGTTNLGAYSQAWYVSFGSGGVSYTSKSYTRYVRCVRGGQ